MRPQNVDVLMLGWELPPHNTGGLGVACYGLTRSLSSLGARIAFGLPRQLPQNISFMNVMDHRLQGVSVTAINSLLQAYVSQTQYQQHQQSVTSNHYYPTSIYEEAIRFSDLATDWSAKTPHQLVHVHDWMTFPAGIKAAQKSNKPLITHIHATEYDRTGGNVDPKIAQIEYQGLHQADHIIAVSNYTKDMVTRKYSIPKDKISVVHNGIDVAEFKPTKIRNIFPHHNIVLYVGRLTFQKGVEYFIRAAKEIVQHHPDTIFLIVGDGDMYQQHVLEAASLGIGNKIIFTGFLQGEKLRSTYQMADAFVMPSVSEPYGLVALEAVASGTPAVISRQSGVAETLNHVYIADFWDTHQIAKHINTILSFPVHSQEKTILAKKEAQELTWDKAATKTLDIYQQYL